MSHLVGTLFSSITSSADNDDDQATAADVDISMEYCESNSPSLLTEGQSKEKIYHRLNEIDILLSQDRFERTNNSLNKHFSLSILSQEEFDNEMKSSKHRCAFKREILSSFN